VRGGIVVSAVAGEQSVMAPAARSAERTANEGLPESAAAPTMVQIVRHLFVDRRRFEEIFPGGRVRCGFREPPALRGLIPKVVGVVHMNPPKDQLIRPHSLQRPQTRWGNLKRRRYTRWEGQIRPCLTAAPGVAPGMPSVYSRYAEVRTSSSAVIAALFVGGSIVTSLWPGRDVSGSVI
jgi:hypothetical protein